MNSISTSPDTPPKTRGVRKWFGSAGFVALGVFILGRLALEPLRSMPHYDERGMDGFSAVETFRIRKDKTPIKIAFFGSSQSIWGIRPEFVEEGLGLRPGDVRNCATPGGTIFEAWVSVRRNPELFAKLDLAIIEINPFLMTEGREGDPRLATSISRHATLQERLLLKDPEDRDLQLAEWVLPWQSVRRSAYSAFLNFLQPAPGSALYPNASAHAFLSPSMWTQPLALNPRREVGRLNLTPMQAAKRLMGPWRLSKLQDHCMRSLLAWFDERKIPILFHELPLHPEVAKIILADEEMRKAHADFHEYFDALRSIPSVKSSIHSPEDFGGDAGVMADRMHLTFDGAQAYTKFLLPFIHEALGHP